VSLSLLSEIHTHIPYSMIYKNLKLLAQQLNDYLKLNFRLKEDLVHLSAVKLQENSLPSNRVSISVIGLERETGAGITFNRKALSGAASGKTVPSWQVNVNVLIAVIFQEKQYEESLQVFSALTSFLQKNNVISMEETGTSFSLEPVNLSINELSNLWSICGENYYPSIYCRMRVITVDEQEVTDLSYMISKPETDSTIRRR